MPEDAHLAFPQLGDAYSADFRREIVPELEKLKQQAGMVLGLLGAAGEHAADNTLVPSTIPKASGEAGNDARYPGRTAFGEYKLRRARERIFEGYQLFSEPAWDILLDLYAHHKRGRNVTVTSACIAACVPQTTGLRWVEILELRGLVSRESDPKDKRRHFVRLTELAIEKMDIYLRLPL